MFIKRLTISSLDGVLRDITFHEGLNLIVDKTPEKAESKVTGNDVGKTTVLRLIDYCLAGERKPVYSDPEQSAGASSAVQAYLEERQVEVELELVDRLDTLRPGRRVTIRRSFLSGKKRALCEIDGVQVPQSKLRDALTDTLFPSLSAYKKPTFRQVIKHNIRIDERQLNHTLRFLNQSTKDVEYESLFLFMFGCPREDAAEKEKLTERLRFEDTYLKRLREGRSEGDYQAAKDALHREIEDLEERRRHFEASPSLESDLKELDGLAVETSRLRSRMSQIDVRMGLIESAVASLENARSHVDVDELRNLYQEASAYVPGLQRSFEELLSFHNGMLEERKSFIAGDAPRLTAERDEISRQLSGLSAREDELSQRLNGVMTSAEFEELIIQVNERYRQMGEYDDRLTQIEEVKQRLKDIRANLEHIAADDDGAFKIKIQEKLDAFNRFFSAVSNELYGESYIVSVDQKTNRNGVRYYDFHTVEVRNVGSGKKQGEILCFDIAYTRFADEQHIDCLHFILNDKKELVHGNQLAKIAELARRYGVQIVISMLHDKLAPGMDSKEFVILELSQEDKLFRMEGSERR